jgi:hypothetical protein
VSGDLHLNASLGSKIAVTLDEAKIEQAANLAHEAFGLGGKA